jgi:HAE1 family hydrophobic/amphiphilic exporter-1
VDLDTTYRGGKPELAIEIDRERAANMGVPVAAIATTIRALIAGDKVTEFKDGLDIYDVTMRLPDRIKEGFAALSNLKVRAGTGQLVDLASVVRVTHTEGPSQIERQARQRQITVLANLEGISLGQARQLVDATVPNVVPAHLTTDYVGMAEVMQESFLYMIMALLLAVIFVYMLLAAQFNSFIHPFTIMLSLPLSVVGAFGGLYLSRMTLNIFSMIGVIMLMGLVTKNAILLVDYTNTLRARGMSAMDALLEAGPVRLRPILMTTAAMIFGMLPVALALSEGGEVRAPMAITVIGGLLTSMVLTLVVIPVVYSLFVGSKGKRPVGHLGDTPTVPQ